MSDDFVPVGSQSGNEDMAETFYEKKEYPLVPEGIYNVIIAHAELRESKSERDPPGTTKINLRLEILSDLQGNNLEYDGDDEKKHRYQVFARPLAKNYGDGKKTGKASNLYKLIMELTGIPPLTEEKDAERRLSDGRVVTGKLITFDYKMLVNMQCQIVLKHKEYQGKMYPQIDSYLCDTPTQLSNYDLLPPEHPKKIPHPKRAGQGVSNPKAPQAAIDEVFKPDANQPAPKKPAEPLVNPSITAAKEKEAVEEVSEHRTPEQEAATKAEMEARGFPM